MGIVDGTHQLPRKFVDRSSPDDIQQITEVCIHCPQRYNLPCMLVLVDNYSGYNRTPILRTQSR